MTKEERIFALYQAELVKCQYSGLPDYIRSCMRNALDQYAVFEKTMTVPETKTDK